MAWCIASSPCQPRLGVDQPGHLGLQFCTLLAGVAFSSFSWALGSLSLCVFWTNMRI